MSIFRKAIVRNTDFRPPSAGAPSPLERDCQPRPRAAACPPLSEHEKMLDGVSDGMIAGIIADAEKRNLRDQRDHELRWWSQRSSAARAIRRERKAAGTWTLPPKRKFSAARG